MRRKRPKNTPDSRYLSPSRPSYGGPRRRRRLVLWILCGLLLAGILAFGLIQLRIRLVSSPYRLDSAEQAPQAQAIVVLGAKVEESGALSPALRDRLELGLALYRQGKAPKLLATGDGENLSRNETAAMEAYLLENGVPQQDILLDPHGLNTYASLYRAKHKYGLENVLIVTQNYHLGRSLYLARRLGLECHGLGAPDSVFQPINIPYNYARESLARVKAFLNAEIQRLEVSLED